MRTLPVLMLGAALLLSGCATPLTAVRGFADETRKLGAAFDPLLAQALVHCRQQFLQRRAYTSEAPLARFDPAEAERQAVETCARIEQENQAARQLAQALADYGSRLGALAGDGLAASFNDDVDALMGRVDEFGVVSKAQQTAVASLLKYVARALTAQAQHEAIAEALAQEEAVGALADALVVHAERVYTAFLDARLRDQPVFLEVLRGETASPATARVLMLEVHAQTQRLTEQRKTTAALRKAVAQMKASLRDLRENMARLDARERRQAVQQLAKDVRALHQQLDRAF